VKQRVCPQMRSYQMRSYRALLYQMQLYQMRRYQMRLYRAFALWVLSHRSAASCLGQLNSAIWQPLSRLSVHFAPPMGLLRETAVCWVVEYSVVLFQEIDETGGSSLASPR
jgi:hypothetical protein